jgi:Fe-S-cluster containining protein
MTEPQPQTRPQSESGLESRPESRTITVDFKIRLEDGTIGMSAVVPEGQCNITDLLPALQSLDQSLLSSVEEQLGEAGLKVSCRAGCGACCRQMVPLSLFEAEALAAWIRTLPEATQQTLAGRFHAALTKLSAAGIIDRLTQGNWFAEEESARQLTIDYFFLGVPCPFLVEESCSIHPIRPLVCREYLVTSDPIHCKEPTTLKVAPVPFPLHLAHILNRMGAEIEPGTQGWIPLVFLFAWMESGAHPGRAYSGSGPQVLYEFVRRAQYGEHPKKSDAEKTGDSADQASESLPG